MSLFFRLNITSCVTLDLKPSRLNECIFLADHDPQYLSFPGSHLRPSELPTSLHLVKKNIFFACVCRGFSVASGKIYFKTLIKIKFPPTTNNIINSHICS